MGWGVACMGEERGVYRVLVGKPEGKRPLGRPRHRCEDNIRMNLQEVGCGYMDWIGRPHDRDRWQTLVSAVMNLRVPWDARNFLTSCKPVSFSRRTLHHAVSMIMNLENQHNQRNLSQCLLPTTCNNRIHTTDWSFSSIANNFSYKDDLKFILHTFLYLEQSLFVLFYLYCNNRQALNYYTN